jgi:ornithine carbamoyltransferase
MAAQRGMEVVVLHPEGFALPDALLDKARQAAAASGGSVRATQDRDEALHGADVVYAKEWTSTAHYGVDAADAAARRKFSHWCVNEEWFAATRAEARLMHCLPVRRNVAVSDGVLDSARSVVVRQAANRLPAQMAVLYRLLKSSP